ncbi:Crp/Fnr family transcriptional regulator [Tamlana sp. 2201CG12-4]|uniref:Crp/Fnr family transcriptional regulator n=1 Tax=Tamlana sp. 2201CG12-4 TaxID=3112582 RepID=UPI002DBC7079|nr:Crp/Fnr family transcriptional regulator [Tamlana sp. 2201CG12-4]MEC3908825.1 Crp/Fnr family transcriptional regulator [Tamlana sp. 2201CG12-4]
MKGLITDIKSTIEISNTDLENIIARFHSKTFSKSDMIPSFGKTANHIQFIQQGLIRVYTIDNQAKDVTLQIGIENMWVNNLYSYITRTPSEYYIEVLEPTILLQLHRDDLEDLFKEVPPMERYFRLKREQSYIRLHNRTLHQRNHSAEERYIKFRNTYGYIENRVPQYIIASYLNLSPEHLSKIRNHLAKKEFLNSD